LGGEGWFFSIFGLDFLPAQAMKSTPIYWGWGGVEKGNLVFIGEKFQPLIRLVRIPIVGSK